jgi:hypothetical protein
VDVSVPQTSNVSVEVSTYNGEFDAGFPVPLTRISRNRFSFVLGSGSARLNLESFQGTIRLHRPGETTRSDRRRGHDREHERQMEKMEKQREKEREKNRRDNN